MDTSTGAVAAFLQTVHPYDSLPQDELVRVAGSFSRREYAAGETVYQAGDPLTGLYLVYVVSRAIIQPSVAPKPAW